MPTPALDCISEAPARDAKDGERRWWRNATYFAASSVENGVRVVLRWHVTLRCGVWQNVKKNIASANIAVADLLAPAAAAAGARTRPALS